MDDVSGELMRIEREARRDQVSAEADAVQLHQARRSIAEFAWELLQAGGRLRVSWLGGEVVGDPVSAVGDLLVLSIGADEMAIRLGSVISITEDGKSDRATLDVSSDVGSFVAWCRMAEGIPATVTVIGGASVRGVIAAVTQDHLLIRNTRDTAVALSGVVGVRVSADRLFGV